MRELMVSYIEQGVQGKKAGRRVRGPLVPASRGKLGRNFPVDANPHEFLLP
jgi:hypothetical protein